MRDSIAADCDGSAYRSRGVDTAGVGSAGTAREESPTGKVAVGAAVAEGVAVADQASSVLAADPIMLPAPGARPVKARNAWGRDFEMWPGAEGGWCGVMHAVDTTTGAVERMRWWMQQAAGDEARARYEANQPGSDKA